MARTETVSPPCAHDADTEIRLIMEGTAAQSGERFFAALVRSLAEVLGVAGAWVTEYRSDTNRLRALSFWFKEGYVADFEYDITGTPCEPVIRDACLIHFAENIVALYPNDADLRTYGAVSYLGAPLLDAGGGILGHVAVLDTRPMPMQPRLEALFRIFAARAAAELQRQRAEQEIRQREEKLSRLFNSAMDAVIEMDSDLTVTAINRSAASAFACEPDQMSGRDFRDFLFQESAAKLARLARELEARPPDRQYLWIPGGLRAQRVDGAAFPAEASLSRFEFGREGFFTVILRNMHDQIEAERRLEFLAKESAYLKEEIDEIHNHREIIGRSAAIEALRQSVSQVAPTGATVLIYGETGTGKELVARATHAASRRAGKPLVKVNCAAIPAALMESEFFGHEKGAFTGATQRREGRFALADGGTIFLDEIGELPVDLQAKLLRVLQEGEFEPVGSSQTRRTDVRVIAATNRRLEEAIKSGAFREDLYYRLNVFPLRVPPLRERDGDVELLAETLLKRFCVKAGIQPPAFSAECIRRLRGYDWPGNVRELQNAVERAVITSRDGRLNPDVLLPSTQAVATAAAIAAPAQVLSARELLQLERDNLVRALESTGWKVAGPDGAARLLGIPASTLASRMAALKVTRPR